MGALLLLAATGGALWLLARLEGAQASQRPRAEAPEAPEEARLPPSAVTPLTGATLTPPELADPAQARALELLLERRAAYQAMLDGFKGHESRAAQARLEPALQARWPRAGPVAWKVSCRGETCRLEVEGAPDGWPATLLEHAAIRAVVDRVVADPDDGRRPAYLVLAAERARPGAGILDAVARQLEEGGEAAECLEGAPAGTSVALELEVDATGVTFRASGGATGEQRECVTGALSDVLASTRVEPGARSATRTVVVRAAP